MENLIFLCLSVFIIYSLVQISCLLQQFLVSEAQSVRSFLVVALSGKMDDVEVVARKYMLKCKFDKQMQLVLVDVGLDDKARKICERFCQTHSEIIFCLNNQLSSILQSTFYVCEK